VIDVAGVDDKRPFTTRGERRSGGARRPAVSAAALTSYPENGSVKLLLPVSWPSAARRPDTIAIVFDALGAGDERAVRSELRELAAEA
jgi:hypothetical protein